MNIFSAGCDNLAKMWDINTGQSQQIAQVHFVDITFIGVLFSWQHQAPIKEILFLEGYNLVATASWDKTLRYWDCRSPQAVATINLPERAYAMDALPPLLVVATADRHVVVYDLKNPSVAFKVRHHFCVVFAGADAGA